jgi:histidinol-phosphatase (PHP family)
MFDNHIHSKFSTDSKMDAEEACKRAVEIGLTGVVFTDHVDYDYPDFDESFLINFDKYFEVFSALKASWKEKLVVLTGVEMGFQPQVLEPINRVLLKYPFDFVINSVHIIDHMDPYTGAFFRGRTQQQSYERYLEEILVSVGAYDNYDVIGHIGYAARYGDFEDKPLRYADYSDLLDQILKAVIARDKGIEINTSGLRSDLKQPIPGYDVFKRYFELGGEIITVGSDAHFAEHLGHSFKEAVAHLKDIGFKYVAHFEKRKPVFEKLVI